MDTKRKIATDIALQTRVLRQCTQHHRLFFDDADPAPAFELALELLHQRAARVAVFNGDSHQLTNLICDVIAASPVSCADCRAARLLSWELRAAADELPLTA